MKKPKHAGNIALVCVIFLLLLVVMPHYTRHSSRVHGDGVLHIRLPFGIEDIHLGVMLMRHEHVGFLVQAGIALLVQMDTGGIYGRDGLAGLQHDVLVGVQGTTGRNLQVEELLFMRILLGRQRSLALLGTAMVALGLWLAEQPPVNVYWLMPFGLPWRNFLTSDYFPLFPNLGFFLLGAALGRTIYSNKQTLFPKVNENTPLLAFFRLCGKHSLWIYLAHQPILSGFFMLLTLH